MKKFRINWNHAVASMPDNYQCNKLFGDGVTLPVVEAENEDGARSHFANWHAFNRFYIKATEIK